MEQESRMENKKAQISVDFIIVLSVALLVFLVLFNIISNRRDDMNSASTLLAAKEVADKLAIEVNTIHLAGDGAFKTVTLPETLRDNSDYNITIYPKYHVIEVNWNYLGNMKKYSSAIVTGNVNGSISSINGFVNLTNDNGVIMVDN